MSEAEIHDDLGNPLPEESHAEVVPHDPEPVMPEHLRLESGHMSELMDHIKAWFAWTGRQPS